MDSKQFLERVIKPTLVFIGHDSKAAQQLLLGTALTESNLTHISQIPVPIARGFFQVEKPTHDDYWNGYLERNQRLRDKVLDLMNTGMGDFEQVEGNMYYAAALARVHYLRIKEAIPQAGDIEGMARYWKKYYNTHLGKGTVEHFLKHKATIERLTK